MYGHEAGGVAVSACADILRHDSGESLNTRPWPKILDHYRRPGGNQQSGKKHRDLRAVVFHGLSSVLLCPPARCVMGVIDNVVDELFSTSDALNIHPIGRVGGLLLTKTEMYSGQVFSATAFYALVSSPVTPWVCALGTAAFTGKNGGITKLGADDVVA